MVHSFITYKCFSNKQHQIRLVHFDQLQYYNQTVLRLICIYRSKLGVFSATETCRNICIKNQLKKLCLSNTQHVQKHDHPLCTGYKASELFVVFTCHYLWCCKCSTGIERHIQHIVLCMVHVKVYCTFQNGWLNSCYPFSHMLFTRTCKSTRWVVQLVDICIIWKIKCLYTLNGGMIIQTMAKRRKTKRFVLSPTGVKVPTLLHCPAILLYSGLWCHIIW